MPRQRHGRAIRIRSGRMADLDDLIALEAGLFTVDRLSRRSFVRLLGASSAILLVAECRGGFAGYVLVLIRSGSRVARLYSIGVARSFSGRGIGAALLKAAERAAFRRGADVMRLEVQTGNAVAIRRYERSGYRCTGRAAAYYEDGGDALRYEKRIRPLAANWPHRPSSPLAKGRTRIM